MTSTCSLLTLLSSVGVSQGQFYDQYLKFIRLNDQAVSFGEADVTALLKDVYDPAFHREVYEQSQSVRLAKTLSELLSHNYWSKCENVLNSMVLSFAVKIH